MVETAQRHSGAEWLPQIDDKDNPGKGQTNGWNLNLSSSKISALMSLSSSLSGLKFGR